MRFINRTLCIVVLIFVVGTVAPDVQAHHFYDDGWRDKHVNYKPRPHGYAEIVHVFGQPCNSKVNDNVTKWVAGDNGVSYTVKYHQYLGGYGKYYGGVNDPRRSSNLNNDVRGHIRNEHLSPKIKSGIYGYACRYIDGTRRWSLHAFGAAIDINSRYEHVGSAHEHCHSIPYSVSSTWWEHGWHHGVSFGDCMHFQYATGY